MFHDEHFCSLWGGEDVLRQAQRQQSGEHVEPTCISADVARASMHDDHISLIMSIRVGKICTWRSAERALLCRIYGTHGLTVSQEAHTHAHM